MYWNPFLELVILWNKGVHKFIIDKKWLMIRYKVNSYDSQNVRNKVN